MILQGSWGLFHTYESTLASDLYPPLGNPSELPQISCYVTLLEGQLSLKLTASSPHKNGGLSRFGISSESSWWVFVHPFEKYAQVNWDHPPPSRSVLRRGYITQNPTNPQNALPLFSPPQVAKARLHSM